MLHDPGGERLGQADQARFTRGIRGHTSHTWKCEAVAAEGSRGNTSRPRCFTMSAIWSVSAVGL